MAVRWRFSLPIWPGSRHEMRRQEDFGPVMTIGRRQRDFDGRHGRRRIVHQPT